MTLEDVVPHANPSQRLMRRQLVYPSYRHGISEAVTHVQTHEVGTMLEYIFLFENVLLQYVILRLYICDT